MRRIKRKKSAEFCALLIVLFLLLSVLFLVKEANHNCTGADCPICAAMQQCEDSIRLLGTGQSASAVSIRPDFTFIQIPWVAYLLFLSASTLVSKQIRMNN